ncbi:MAG: NAD(P)/FAD-dependent oxidoreductase [Myxococcota bacterium]
MPKDFRPHVVIVGGGFGGLNVAQALKSVPVRITLIDKHNHHTFQPLLYQVATAGLSAPDIAAPIRQIFKNQKNVTVLLGEVTDVRARDREICLDSGGQLSYDYLILAVGAVNHWFGNDWEKHAPGLKTLSDALEIRRRILTAFEAAERESDPNARESWLTFAIIGAGPTGVELAGSVIDIAQKTLARDFRHFDPKQTRVILVEGAERVLPPYPETLSAKARKQLEDLGVEVRTGTLVTHLDEYGVTLKDGTQIATRTVLWGAGVKANPLLKTLDVALGKGGRAVVSGDLSLPAHPEIFVIGDAAQAQLTPGQDDGRFVPGVAPAAMQMGTYVARVIKQRQKGAAVQPFKYVDKGSLATIGRNRAVADFGFLHLSGFVAWFLWMAVHVIFLVGFRNRVAVLFEWAWAYISFGRSARVILSRPRELPAIRDAADATLEPTPQDAPTPPVREVS